MTAGARTRLAAALAVAGRGDRCRLPALRALGRPPGRGRTVAVGPLLLSLVHCLVRGGNP